MNKVFVGLVGATLVVARYGQAQGLPLPIWWTI
jgi:hypothetical protein